MSLGPGVAASPQPAAGAADRNGLTIPLTDVQIAVLAMENEAELWSRDAHFARIGDLYSGLVRFQPEH